LGIEAPPKADLVHDGLALCNRRPRTNCPSVALSTVIPHNGFLSLLHESATLSNNYLFQRAVSSWGSFARWFAYRRRWWISVAGKYQDARAKSPQLLCQLTGGWLGLFRFPLRAHEPTPRARGSRETTGSDGTRRKRAREKAHKRTNEGEEERERRTGGKKRAKREHKGAGNEFSCGDRWPGIPSKLTRNLGGDE
jgi:hypothetical protein